VLGSAGSLCWLEDTEEIRTEDLMPLWIRCWINSVWIKKYLEVRILVRRTELGSRQVKATPAKKTTASRAESQLS
jgi:hypothetical protein